jgi:hypothetical protein
MAGDAAGGVGEEGMRQCLCSRVKVTHNEGCFLFGHESTYMWLWTFGNIMILNFTNKARI